MSFDDIEIGDYIETQTINKKGDRNLDGMILRGVVEEIEQCENSYGKWTQIRLDNDWRVHRKDIIREHLKANRFKLFMDGDQWCATYPNFIDLQESPAGFGSTKVEALINLFEK